MPGNRGQPAGPDMLEPATAIILAASSDAHLTLLAFHAPTRRWVPVPAVSGLRVLPKCKQDSIAVSQPAGSMSSNYGFWKLHLLL